MVGFSDEGGVVRVGWIKVTDDDDDDDVFVLVLVVINKKILLG